MPRPLPDSVLAVTDGSPEQVRAHILSAAVEVMTRKGVSAASTRAIAEEAALSGGTLYNYFSTREELVARAIVHRSLEVTASIAAFPARAGTHTVARNLQFFVTEAGKALDRILPLLAAAFADPGLLDAVRRAMLDSFPLNDPATAVERYLLAERRLGRVATGADCRAVASILVGLCHDDAFQRHLHASDERPTRHKENWKLPAHIMVEERRLPARLHSSGPSSGGARNA